jgi:hypothetical protein
MPGCCSINCTKTKLAASSTFRAIVRNKRITEARYRTADTRKPRGNAIVRRLACLEVEFLGLSASCVAVSSICAAPFSNMCSTQADNSQKMRLCCGCRSPWCALALTVQPYGKVHEPLLNAMSNLKIRQFSLYCPSLFYVFGYISVSIASPISVTRV